MRSIFTTLVRLVEARYVSKLAAYECGSGDAIREAGFKPIFAELARLGRVARQSASQIERMLFDLDTKGNES
jgi:hypothetical protein